jgi:glycogen operon protein
MRTFLATLAFSQGVPMLSHGDELGRTQRGNNNAYAQDNELTWIDWNLDDRQKQLAEFLRKVLAIRQTHPVLRRRHFFRGAPLPGSQNKDVTWLHPSGREFTADDWHNSSAQAFGMLLDGAATDEVDERGHAVSGDSLLMAMNAGEESVTFTLPVLDSQKIWVVMVDTARDTMPTVRKNTVVVEPHSLLLLRFGADRRIAKDGQRREPLTPVEKHTL